MTDKPDAAPVAWLITDEKINSLQVASIQRLIDRLKHAHHTDICVRINGKDERYEADWLKHLTRAAPQPAVPRKPLTEEQIAAIVRDASRGAATRRDGTTSTRIIRAVEAAHGITGEKQQ